ncbi:hypothetical protein PG985_006052 [Apiospora marii]|uniref:Uncharacterized protein n=1 Tax=Apiospora marii TaxID=335849 RepID=A0ABR1S6H9_9PEZI
MSLRKISPGVYISVVPEYMEASFESMCDGLTGLWKHPPTRPVDGRALAREESFTESDDYHPKSSPGSHSPCPHDRTNCKGPCLTYTFTGPPRSGPPASRPDPCIPKGHVVVMVPKVPPKSIPSPYSCPIDSNGHVFIVVPEEQEEQEGSGNYPPTTDASEPLRSPRRTSPQPTSSVQDPPDAGSAPSSSSSGACSSATAWVAATSAPPDAELKGGQAAEQTPAAECVLCGNHLKMSAWDEHAGPPPPNPQPWPNQPRPRPGLPSKHKQPVVMELTSRPSSA